MHLAARCNSIHIIISLNILGTSPVKITVVLMSFTFLGTSIEYNALKTFIQILFLCEITYILSFPELHKRGDMASKIWYTVFSHSLCYEVCLALSSVKTALSYSWCNDPFINILQLRVARSKCSCALSHCSQYAWTL